MESVRGTRYGTEGLVCSQVQHSECRTVLNFCDTRTFLHMLNIKTILKDIRRQLQQFIEKYPEDIQEASLSLAKSPWGNIRFTNHINFLGKCLKFKVVPKGFKLKLHSPIKRTILQRHLTSFANKLIRSSINHFRYQQTEFSKELPSLTLRLQFYAILETPILKYARKYTNLIKTLYNFLKTTKDKILKELINDQKQGPIDGNQAISTPINNIKNTPNFQSNNHNDSVSVFDSRQQRLVKTIPDDLPLTTAERSLLSKNLKFVPLRSTVKEFQVKHDAEEFFKHLRLKAHFQNRMVKPASNDNTSTLTSTDSCNDSIDFHFPSFDNFLDSSYSEEEDSFASKLIKNLFPTKSGWTPPDGRFSSLDL